MRSSAPPARRSFACLWRHLWLDEHDARRDFGREALHRLTLAVQDSERQHQGEIRICVEAALPLSRLLTRCSARQRAQELYGRLGLGRTHSRKGVLLYLLLADRAIEIVADPALHGQVPKAAWETIIAAVQQRLGQQAQAGEATLFEALASLDAVLRERLPKPPGDADGPNELPDEPVMM